MSKRHLNQFKSTKWKIINIIKVEITNLYKLKFE